MIDIENGTILEQFSKCTFDPESANYFAKMIGDRWVEIDSNGKLTYYGNYPNLSKYIRVGDYADMEQDGVFKYPKTVVPMGHASVKNPVPVPCPGILDNTILGAFASANDPVAYVFPVSIL